MHCLPGHCHLVAFFGLVVQRNNPPALVPSIPPRPRTVGSRVVVGRRIVGHRDVDVSSFPASLSVVVEVVSPATVSSASARCGPRSDRFCRTFPHRFPFYQLSTDLLYTRGSIN